MQHDIFWHVTSRLCLIHWKQRLKLLLMMAAFVVVLTLGSVPEARAIFIRSDVPVNLYNDLATQPQFQAAGYLGTPGATEASCSGTLVTPVMFLTAAHCLDRNADGVSDEVAENLVVGFDVNFPENGLPINNVSGFSINPNWEGSSAFDLAVLKLTTPILEVTPTQILLQNPLGLLGTMIGYGYQGTGLGGSLIGANNRLGAHNIIDQCDWGGICTDFDKPDGSTSTYGASSPVSLEGTTYLGDSGGPLFVNFDDQALLVGVLSTGWNPFDPIGWYGDISIWTPLQSPANVTFLQEISPDIKFASIPIPSTLYLMLIGYWIILRQSKTGES